MRRFWIMVAVCAFSTSMAADSRAQQFVYGDFDTSGSVDFTDFSKLVRAFDGGTNTPAQVDLNTDGVVDGEDAFLFADIFSDNSSEANLTVSTGPNTLANLELDPKQDGFLVYLNNVDRMGGYRLILTMPDSVKLTRVEDHLGIGLLPVRQFAGGVEIVGLVLGNKAISQSGLIAGLSFTVDSTGVADTRGVSVTGVHLRGPRVELGNHLYLGDRNTVASGQIKRIAEGDLLIPTRIFDLGMLAPGEKAIRTIDIKNTFDNQQAPGTSRKLAFEITPSDASIAVDPQTFGVLADTSTGVASGVTKSVTATIIPSVNGVYSETVDIKTNRSERPLIRVHFKARVENPSAGSNVRVDADFDSSGTVDYGDFDDLITRFGSTPDSTKFDLDGDGIVDADDAFLFADFLGGFRGRASFDSVRVIQGLSLGGAVRAQDSGEELTLSVRNLVRLGGYRLILQYDASEVELRWARDLSGGGAMPIHKTATGAEIVGMGFGALVEHAGDRGLARISVRPLKGQAHAASLVTVTGLVFRGDRGERDSVGVVRIGANGLDASPRVLDFGRLRLGATAEKVFKIYNLNSASTSFQIVSSDTLVTTRPKSVGNLGSGRTWDVKVALSVVAPGPFSSTLTVSAIGDDPSPITLAVKAFGAVVGVVPDSLAFGDVFVGQSSTKNLTVSNPDLTAFEISAWDFSRTDTAFVIDSAPTLPLSIPGEGGTQTLSVRFNPLVQGEALDTLRVVGADTTFAIPLAGKGLLRAAEVVQSSLDFGSVDLGRDTTLSVQISNAGNVPYVLDSLTVGGQDTSFAGISLPSFPDTLVSQGASDTLTVRFRPDTTGVKNDTLRIYSADSTWVVPLTGTGLPRPVVEPPPVENVLVVTFGGTITKSRNFLHFGKVTWGKTDSLKVRVQNRRNGNLTFRFVATDSQIAVQPDSVQNLPHNQEWDVVLRLTPTDSIQTLSDFKITTNDAGDGVTTIPVKSGGSNPELLPASLDFGTVGVGNGLTRNLTLTNTGHTRLVLETLALGTDSAFSVVSPPALPLAVAEEGGKLNLQVRFEPNARGSFVDVLRFGGVDTSVAMTLSGRGRESRVALSPDSLAFGLLAVGQADTLTSVLQNAGQDTVVVDSLYTRGANSPFALIDFPSLPDTLIAGATRNLRVAFAPTTAAASRDTLRVLAGLDTLRVEISGTGTLAQATVSSASVDFGQPEVGRTQHDTVRISNGGNVPYGIRAASLRQGNRGFALTGDLSQDIAVGGTLVLPLRFVPDSTDVRVDSLQVEGMDTTFVITLNGQGAPSLSITGRDTGLAFSHKQLDFGNLATDGSGRRIIRVKNETASPLSISTVVSDAALTIRPTSLSALPPDIVWDLVAQWTPTAQSPLKTDIRVTSGRTYSVPAGRQGIFAALLTDSLAFGDVRLGQSNTQTVRVRNNGQGTAVVQSLGLGSETGFSVVGAPDFPVVLQERDSLVVPVKFAPAVAGETRDTLRIVGRDTSFFVPLEGRGISAVVSLNFTTFDFGDLIVGTDSVAAIAIQNSGNGTFGLDSLQLVSPQGMFAVTSGGNTPDSLAANGGVDTVRVRFRPTDLGDYSGALHIYGGSSRFDVSLSGRSTVGNATDSDITVAFGTSVTRSDSTLNFGDIPIGSTRKLSFVVQNNRDSTLVVKAASTDAQVIIEPDSIGGLLPGQPGTFVVSFTPVVEGATTVAVHLTSNASPDGSVRLLAQKNRAPVRVAPLELAFGNVLVGSEDTLKTTITNPQILNYRVTAYTFGNRGPFSLVDGPVLPDTVRADGGMRTLTVKFAPSTRGNFVDTLRIIGADKQFAVVLSGTGQRALAVAGVDSLDFGARLFGEDSIRSVSVSNRGDVPLTLSRVEADNGSFALVDSLSLPLSVPVDSTATVRVRFSPQQAGSIRGQVEFGFAAQSVNISLVGVGIAPPRTEPGPIALDLDATFGDQGLRIQELPGRDVLVDLVATEGALGKTGFEVVVGFDSTAVAYRDFAIVDLFEGATQIVTEGGREIRVSVVFFQGGAVTRDSGSIGQLQFGLLGDASPTVIQIASAQYALPTGPVVLEIGSVGASVTVSGAAEPSGDFNGDGLVDFNDFIAFAGAFGSQVGDSRYGAEFDLDSNGEVGFSDFIIFAAKFGSGTSGATKPARN